MWINRDFIDSWRRDSKKSAGLVKVLKGPRQVGKTSLLESLGTHQLILFDDHILRTRANENPDLFLSQFQESVILDEATLVPSLFLEIKKRVDQIKRNQFTGKKSKLDYWITGSNQTLLSREVSESLAGRADLYNLNTLSAHELNLNQLSTLLIRGGWPELYSNPELDSTRYLNNLISTFIEKDILQAAGIEKKSAFTKMIQLLSGQVGQLINFSAIASACSVESTTIQSWALILEQNNLIKILQPFMNTFNKRLIKSPKVYFEDVALAARFQGWTSFQPLFVSPYFGQMVENLVYSEISRFFTNRIIEPKVYFIRNKEKVEIDFLLELPNKKFVAIEAKASPQDFSNEQLKLIESLGVNVIEHWIVTPQHSQSYGNRKIIEIRELYSSLGSLLN